MVLHAQMRTRTRQERRRERHGSVVCAEHAEQRASRSPGARRGAAQRGPRESTEDVERLNESALNESDARASTHLRRHICGDTIVATKLRPLGTCPPREHLCS